jgi:hypothetical protein
MITGREEEGHVVMEVEIEMILLQLRNAKG